MTLHKNFALRARPFLKWAGGKTQLLEQFSVRLPLELKNGEINTYIEPFIGGGAMFFSINHEFPLTHSYLMDKNEELILSYRVIKKSMRKLIDALESLESEYISSDPEGRQRLYYKVRQVFNQEKPRFNFHQYNPDWIQRAARIIFLNHTCYNGLFRENRNGEFNVPFGKYENPQILDKENLKKVALLLKKATIISGDFTGCKQYVDNKTFVYIDPPYRPLNRTSSFTSYSKEGFSDEDQCRLAGFIKELDKKGAKIMVSNSDPMNEKPCDSFFDDLYADFTIERVPAIRSINCKGSRRGKINELIITNY